MGAPSRNSFVQEHLCGGSPGRTSPPTTVMQHPPGTAWPPARACRSPRRTPATFRVRDQPPAKPKPETCSARDMLPLQYVRL